VSITRVPTTERSVDPSTTAVTVSKLVGVDGKILVPGLDDLVAPLTDEERKRYEVINFGIKVRVV
jgi:Cys-Gly metallodipeptidase DUG1